MEFPSGIYVDSLVKPGKGRNRGSNSGCDAPEAREVSDNPYFTDQAFSLELNAPRVPGRAFFNGQKLAGQALQSGAPLGCDKLNNRTTGGIRNVDEL
jgi:hypothetical protein